MLQQKEELDQILRQAQQHKVHVSGRSKKAATDDVPAKSKDSSSRASRATASLSSSRTTFDGHRMPVLSRTTTTTTTTENPLASAELEPMTQAMLAGNSMMQRSQPSHTKRSSKRSIYTTEEFDLMSSEQPFDDLVSISSGSSSTSKGRSSTSRGTRKSSGHRDRHSLPDSGLSSKPGVRF